MLYLRDLNITTDTSSLIKGNKNFFKFKKTSENLMSDDVSSKKFEYYC